MKKLLKFLIKEVKTLYYKLCLIWARLTENFIKNVKNIRCIKSKKALVIYITHPFKKNIKKLAHTNIKETKIMVDILTDMSFSVDVLDYRYKYPIQSQEYDLIIGFGDAYESIFYQAARPTCILYATGAPLPVQNYAETMRIKAISDVKGINLFPERVFDRTWPCSDILSDAIISVTSGWAKSQFEKHHGNVYSVNITSLSDELVLSDAFIKNKDPRQFVWFSGAGAAHKGLDLCLEVFKEKPDLTLHVIGNLEQEPHFMRHYQSFLHLNNIHYHGFSNSRSMAKYLIYINF